MNTHEYAIFTMIIHRNKAVFRERKNTVNFHPFFSYNKESELNNTKGSN